VSKEFFRDHRARGRASINESYCSCRRLLLLFRALTFKAVAYCSPPAGRRRHRRGNWIPRAVLATTTVRRLSTRLVLPYYFYFIFFSFILVSHYQTYITFYCVSKSTQPGWLDWISIMGRYSHTAERRLVSNATTHESGSYWKSTLLSSYYNDVELRHAVYEYY
jgi:hypothetical protein